MPLRGCLLPKSSLLLRSSLHATYSSQLVGIDDLGVVTDYSKEDKRMFRKLSKKQLGRLLLTIGMMVGMSIVGCVPEQPSRQASPPRASQAECAQLRKSVEKLERDLPAQPLDSAGRPRLEAELATARQGVASCAAKGQ